MKDLLQKQNLTVLAIESSCDETACAIVKNGREVLSNAIATQIEIHRRYGGVVPEIASRNHTLAIENVVREAMERASVTKDDIDWAVGEAARKKKTDFSKVEFLTYEEGLCVQCMHIGSYDDEPATIALMEEYMAEQGYALDITEQRHHHEIYLSDARRVVPERLKTVIRHPVRKV